MNFHQSHVIELSNNLLQVIKIFNKTIELCVDELDINLDDADSDKYDKGVAEIQ